ncbi:MAG TPA: S1C family serine protease [Stellaceae bacterium]|nr:S1C family serine protease [Stellaceae bacterium]
MIDPILIIISDWEQIMPEIVQDVLSGLSEALVERARRAQPLVARIETTGRLIRSGTLWQKDVVVASEQALPEIDEARVTLVDGSTFPARLAGRDPGTNVAVLKLDGSPDPARLPAAEPNPGALALAFGAGGGEVSVRLGIIQSIGPAWHSRAGGRIDRRITLDLTLREQEEGGPVLDAGGGLLGISTLGPRRRVLVIPTTTVEGVLEPLLSKGRVERGWLGLALQPVLVPEGMQPEAGQSRGLMIMGVAKGGPAAQAGVLTGDILLTVGGEGVDRPAMVAQHLGPESVGQPIELRLLRAGKVLSLGATVAARPPG